MKNNDEPKASHLTVAVSDFDSQVTYTFGYVAYGEEDAKAAFLKLAELGNIDLVSDGRVVARLQSVSYLSTGGSQAGWRGKLLGRFNRLRQQLKTIVFGNPLTGRKGMFSGWLAVFAVGQYVASNNWRN